MGRLSTYRALSVAHFFVAIPLVALSTFFGLYLVPVLAAIPIWFCVLGNQLWYGPNQRICRWVRFTHLLALFVAAALVVIGVFTLQAAMRSAARGGGLLSPWGFIPLATAVLLAALAIASLSLVGPEPLVKPAQ
jgi:hypothetical protein